MHVPEGACALFDDVKDAEASRQKTDREMNQHRSPDRWVAVIEISGRKAQQPCPEHVVERIFKMKDEEKYRRQENRKMPVLSLEQPAHIVLNEAFDKQLLHRNIKGIEPSGVHAEIQAEDRNLPVFRIQGIVK